METVGRILKPIKRLFEFHLTGDVNFLKFLSHPLLQRNILLRLHFLMLLDFFVSGSVLVGDFFSSLSQSANYCRTTPTDNIGLMMLCEVALGNM